MQKAGFISSSPLRGAARKRAARADAAGASPLRPAAKKAKAQAQAKAKAGEAAPRSLNARWGVPAAGSSTVSEGGEARSGAVARVARASSALALGRAAGGGGRPSLVESHGAHASASLLDLFSPPAKLSQSQLLDDDGSHSGDGRALVLHHRRSLRRSSSSVALLNTTETLSHSAELVTAPSATTSSGAHSERDERAAAAAASTAATATASTSVVETTTTTTVDDEEYYDEEEFDPYLFMAQLPPLPAEYAARAAVLPARAAGDTRPTLVLDLDETLVHCSVDPLEKADFHFPVVYNSVEYKVYVRRRPHFEQFMRSVSELGFELVVFTASQKVYANALLDLLDKEHQLIEHRLFRDSCVNVAGNYLKDLSVLGRDLSRTVIVDNSPQTFGYQLDNGIPIESWFDDDDDRELLDLLPLLERVATSDNVQSLLSRAFGLRSLVDSKRRLTATPADVGAHMGSSSGNEEDDEATVDAEAAAANKSQENQGNQ